MQMHYVYEYQSFGYVNYGNYGSVNVSCVHGDGYAMAEPIPYIDTELAQLDDSEPDRLTEIITS